MECLGGNGYVEESLLPRLYREAPVNAIWEGSGNVMCLDVLRAVGREREAAREVLAALAEETADLSGARAAHVVVERAFSADNPEADARAAVDRLAHLATAAALGQSAGYEIANLFARSRIENRHGAIYGTSEIAPEEARRLIDRALSPA
jgi:putative acyl-CoA dehydrogenase